VDEVIRAEDRGFRHPFWWVGLAFFAACAAAAALSGAGGAAVVPAGFALACGLGLAGRTTVSLDGEGLELQTALGSHRMVWDEVERVETDGARLVLIGEAAALVAASLERRERSSGTGVARAGACRPRARPQLQPARLADDLPRHAGEERPGMTLIVAGAPGSSGNARDGSPPSG
jgi:hypothetical protein